MLHRKLKNFWIKKITDLITGFSLDPNLLDEGNDWAKKITDLEKWTDIDAFAKNLFKDVHAKASKAIPPTFYSPDENYGSLLAECFTDLDLKFVDLANVCKTKIGVDPTDETLATNADGNNVLVDGNPIPKWKHTINKKFPINPANKQFTLDDLGGLDIADLLYRNDLYETIANKVNGLGNLIEKNLAGDDRGVGYGWRWTFKLNKIVLQNYKNNQTTITNAETHLGLNPGDLATITTNAAYNLNGKTLTQLLTPHTCPPCALTHCPNTHANYNTIKGESAEYQRIHTKLSGKVSDDDLTNLLNAAPSCSHSDYDDIKQALANEKEKLTKKEESWELEKQQAQAEKEKEIINKIITDLGLTTERERERERESIRSSNYGNQGQNNSAYWYYGQR